MSPRFSVYKNETSNFEIKLEKSSKIIRNNLKSRCKTKEKVVREGKKERERELGSEPE